MNSKIRANQPMRKACHALTLLSLISAIWMSVHTNTATAGPIVPTTLPAGWEQIDERLVFLTVRLSSDEASLTAVNKAIKLTGYQQSVKASNADAYRHSNEIMDRKGGGPKPWDEFYGRTAEKFFYHPVDPNTVYINPIPISQRPPQLDYIYRANADEQQRAEEEAAALGGKIDKLLQRRRQLEAEQSALWCEIAFQAIASRDLAMKPLYRFDLKAVDTDPAAAEHVEAARAACDFVRCVNQLMSDAQHGVEANQEQVFGQLPGAVDAARKALMDRLSQQPSLLLDLGDPETRIGKVATGAKRLDDLATNILDSYRLAGDGDKAGDDQRKDTFRGMLQDQLLSSAETLFTMDQCVLDLVRDWKLTPDMKAAATQPAGTVSAGSAKNDQSGTTDGQSQSPSRGKPSIFDDPTQQAGNGQTGNGDNLGSTRAEQNDGRAAASLPSEAATHGIDSATGSGSFVGQWEVGEGEQLSFVITVLPGGTASKSNRPNVEGTWTYENDEVRIAWSDGWHDILRRKGDEVTKSAYRPGATYDEPPSNTSAAKKVSVQRGSIFDDTPAVAGKPLGTGISSGAGVKAVDANGLSLDDWGVRCWQGRSWKKFPLNTMQVQTEDDGISVKNMTTSNSTALLAYEAQKVDGDILVSLEYRGNLKQTGIHDNKGDQSITVVVPPEMKDDNWRTLTFARFQNKSVATVAGQPAQIHFYNCAEGKPLVGYFFLSLETGAQFEMRNVHVAVGPSLDVGKAETAEGNSTIDNQRGSDAKLNAALGELSGDQADPVLVLLPRQQPYVVNGEYVVPKQRRLEIQAGVTIVCPSRSHISIQGDIVCSGTQDHPIVFCGEQHKPSWWKGLALDGATSASFTDTQFMDAEQGVKVVNSNPTFSGCVFANNNYGLSVGMLTGYCGGSHGAKLDNCVCSFNAATGITNHNGTVELTSCTITKNGGWGIDGQYMAKLNVKNSIISLNRTGGIVQTNYGCMLDAENSVLSGNNKFDLKNNGTALWDARGNYWGPSLTTYFQGGGQSPPNFKGPVRFEEFLTEMPKQCGASIREINGQSLW